MARSLARSKRACDTRESIARSARLASRMGGRYSLELGIDVDSGAEEVERWFLASTLFGSRISSSIAESTYRVFGRAGVERIAQARHMSWDLLVELLDRGGYARYDFRMASRLIELSDVLHERYGGRVAELGRRFPSYETLRGALDELPGWGPVTVNLFLRELRGVWRGAEPPLGDRARWAARHLDLLGAVDEENELESLRLLASGARLDARDLESALVRLALAHRAAPGSCPGGGRCVALGRLDATAHPKAGDRARGSQTRTTVGLA